MAVTAKPVKAFPKAPLRTLGNNLIERVNHWRVLGRPVHCGFVERRPRETHDLASFGLGDLMVLNHHHDRRSLCCRRYNFRDKTSLIAEFSKASSANMRLSLPFSASRSLIRLSSLAETPAYLLFHW